MACYFENTNKDIVMSEEDVEDDRTNIICRLCAKELTSDKVREHCHLTGKYRCPGHNNCNINVTRKQSIFILFVFHKVSNKDCHNFFKELADRKND